MTLQRVLPAFFSRLCAASYVLAAIVGCQGPEPSASRPNIIFLLTDDQRADALSIAGNPILQTPHIDKLANDGVRFTEAHVVALCACPAARVS